MMQNSKIERNSNFELLRILLMLSIVVGHLILQTHCLDILEGGQLRIAVFLSSMRRIAVNIFLMLGCWFMVDSTFKSSRLINLYAELWLYTISIFAFLKIFHIPVGVRDSISAIFPFFGFSLWFVSGYICLIALSPFLKKIFDWDRRTLKNMLIVLTIFIPIMSTIWIKMDTKLDILVWFIYVFLFVGYYKKYLHEKNKINAYFILSIGIITYFIMCSIKYSCLETNNINFVYKYIDAYIKDYKCIPNLLVSVPIFYFFLHLNIGKNKVINFISKSALATYIIHQAPGFYHYLWNNVFKIDAHLNSSHAILYIITIPFVVYFGCIIIDYFRRKFINSLFIKTKIYNKIENLLDNFYLTSKGE